MRLRSAVCLLGRFPALAGVDLEVAEGEAVLVAGPNGAGKTTLLRLLAGLVPLAGGTGEVLGHDLATDRHGARPHLALLGHAGGRELLDAYVRRCSSEGRTVIIASHELERARPLVTREVTLVGGQVQAPAAVEARRS